AAVRQLAANEQHAKMHDCFQQHLGVAHAARNGTAQRRSTLSPSVDLAAQSRRLKRCSDSGRFGSRGVLLGGRRRKVRCVRKMTLRDHCVMGSELWLGSLKSLRSLLVVKGRRLVMSCGLYVKLGR